MKIEYAIVHITDSKWGTVREVRKWHTDPKRPGGPFRDIGYHFLILNGWILPDFFLPSLIGSIEVGRDLDADMVIRENEIGAHALGFNDRSIGICGVGKEGWNPLQEASLIVLLRDLCKKFDIQVKNVLGHCETESGRAQGKTCPNLNMEAIRRRVAF